MRNCAACRGEIPHDARFCPRCGAPASGVLATAAETIETPSSARPPSAPSDHGRFVPGHRLGERYRIVGLLGRGGMGEVYRADDLELGQSVALKFLPDRFAADPVELDRFRREVRVARGVAHPNVCRTYDIATVDDQVFLVMEYVDGEDLASVLRRMGRPSSDKALEIARQLCLGVGAAHEAGVLHRDLKPANVMIDGRGRVRITDFGLAGLASDLAKEQTIAGTPVYMAPEQLREGRVSAASDVYSLGLILYEIFTGKRVFDTGNVEELKRLHSDSRITSPSSLVENLDPVVERVLLRCLDSNPAARPQSAYAVLAGLPGGDPLAAALAAGETPSPELVADAGEKGVVSQPKALFVMLLTSLLFFGVAWHSGGILESFDRSASELSLLADQVCETLLGEKPPPYRAGGFHRQVADSMAVRAPFDTGHLYWRVYSAANLESDEFHNESVTTHRLSRLEPGDAVVILDLEGRLRGFRRAFPDTVFRAGRLDSSRVLTLLDMDPAAFRAVADTSGDGVLVWEGRAEAGSPVEVRAHFRGMDVEWITVRDKDLNTRMLFWVSAPPQPAPLAGTLTLVVVPVVVASFLTWRNLRLGRGDRRGATVFALLVFCGYMLQSIFACAPEQMSVVMQLGLYFGGRPLGHALYHAAFVWLAYVAIEPYLRRVRPPSLVSWARFVSRRWRDPILGRDVLAGLCLAGLLLCSLSGIDQILESLKGVSTMGGAGDLAALNGPRATFAGVAFAAGYAAPAFMGMMVVFLVFRIIFRRDLIAVAAIPALATVFSIISPGPIPWIATSAATVMVTLALAVALLRFGVVAAVLVVFILLLRGAVVWALAPGAWYGGTAMIAPVLITVLAAWAAVIAMGGRASLGGLLGDEENPRQARA